MSSEWKIYHGDQCPQCGNTLEVFSNVKNKDTEFDQQVNDEDPVRCTECDFMSEIIVLDDEASLQHFYETEE